MDGRKQVCAVTVLGASDSESSSASRMRQAAQAYQEGMSCVWNCEFDRARQILEPWRQTSAWHAGAYAECACLRVAITGQRNEACSALELVAVTDGLLSSSGVTDTCSGGIMRDLFAAEMLLLRCMLQFICGSKLRAFLSLRQCCLAYRRLEHIVSNGAQQLQRFQQEELMLSNVELEGRINFGLGLFYLSTTWLPVSLTPLARLAGFVIDPQRGKAHLAAVMEGMAGSFGVRTPLAASLLAMYHLDLEPDLERGSGVLVQGLTRWPTCVLLHWASSLVAWRNTCLNEAIALTERALQFCGAELQSEAVYLRYELGILHFMACSWDRAFHHLQYVYDCTKSDNVCFFLQDASDGAPRRRSLPDRAQRQGCSALPRVRSTD